MKPLQLLLRLGITTFIIALFFIVNHFELGLFTDVIRIFGTVALFQIVVSYHLWRTNNERMQGMIDKGEIINDFDSKMFIRVAVRGAVVAFGIFVILYLPFYIAIGWVWILSYTTAFILIQHYAKKYLDHRVLMKRLRDEAQLMLDQSI